VSGTSFDDGGDLLSAVEDRVFSNGWRGSNDALIPIVTLLDKLKEIY
jgi:hypothetical protein